MDYNGKNNKRFFGDVRQKFINYSNKIAFSGLLFSFFFKHFVILMIQICCTCVKIQCRMSFLVFCAIFVRVPTTHYWRRYEWVYHSCTNSVCYCWHFLWIFSFAASGCSSKFCVKNEKMRLTLEFLAREIFFYTQCNSENPLNRENG